MKRHAALTARTLLVMALGWSVGTAAPAAAIGDEPHRAPPDSVPYLDTDAAPVIRDNGTTLPIAVEGDALNLYTTAHGYALVSSRSSHAWLTLYDRSGEANVISRRVVRDWVPSYGPVVSGDGERIAFVAKPYADKPSRLVVRRTDDGSFVRRHALVGRGARVLAYRGGRVWFSELSGFAGRLNVATGKVSKFRKGRGDVLAVDPSAGLAVRRDVTPGGPARRIITLGGKPKVVGGLPEFYVLGFSPNDRYVLAYDDDGNDEGTVTHIAVRDARTGRLVRKVNYDWLSWPPKVVWLGSRSFLAARGGGEPSELVRFDLDGSSEVVASYPTYHPESIPWIPATPRP